MPDLKQLPEEELNRRKCNFLIQRKAQMRVRLKRVLRKTGFNVCNVIPTSNLIHDYTTILKLKGKG